LRPCLIHHEVAPAEILAVQGVHRAIRVVVAVYFHEREASRLSRKTVTDEIDAGRGNTDLREPLVELIFRRGKRKIPDIELLHLPHSFCPEPNCESRSAPKIRESYTGSPGSRATTGARLDASAVTCIVSKTNLICNRKDSAAAVSLMCVRTG